MWEEVPRDNVMHDAAQFDLIAAPLPAKGKHKSTAPTLYDYLKHLERTRAGNEDARVLYVAATRAERCLHLIGVARRNDKGELKAPKNTFLELLWPHVYADFAVASEEGQRIQQMEEQDVDEGISLTEFVPKLVRLAAPGIPAIFSQREQKAGVLRRSAEQSVESLAATPEDSLDALVGVLAHRYLEFVARHGLELWPTTRIASLKPAMLKWLQRQGVKPEALDSAAERTIAMLQTTLQSEDGRWLLRPRESASAELPIATLDEETARLQRLDLTFVEDGMRWIIDYKSTAFAPDVSEQALRQQAEMHREQLESYARLFEGEGLPVKTAICFLSVGRLIRMC